MENVNRAQVVDVHELINTLHRQATSNDLELIPVTLSGSVVSFDDPIGDLSLRQCLVNIEPVQSGSGDPSPSNVRPISGWSEVNVYVSPTQSEQDATVYPVTLGQTVYGGTLDVVTGVLTISMGSVDLGSLTWASFSANGRTAFRAVGQIDGVPAGGATGKANALCTQYNVVQNSYIGNTSYDNVIAVGAYWSNGCNVYIYDSAKTSMTGAQFKTAMNGVKLVYELATPTTVQLTPTEVKTILGSNSVWADSGDITVTYVSYE